MKSTGRTGALIVVPVIMLILLSSSFSSFFPSNLPHILPKANAQASVPPLHYSNEANQGTLGYCPISYNFSIPGLLNANVSQDVSDEFPEWKPVQGENPVTL